MAGAVIAVADSLVNFKHEFLESTTYVTIITDSPAIAPPYSVLRT